MCHRLLSRYHIITHLPLLSLFPLHPLHPQTPTQPISIHAFNYTAPYRTPHRTLYPPPTQTIPHHVQTILRPPALLQPHAQAQRRLRQLRPALLLEQNRGRLRDEGREMRGVYVGVLGAGGTAEEVSVGE